MRVRLAGICRTDLEICRGYLGLPWHARARMGGRGGRRAGPGAGRRPGRRRDQLRVRRLRGVPERSRAPLPDPSGAGDRRSRRCVRRAARGPDGGPAPRAGRHGRFHRGVRRAGRGGVRDRRAAGRRRRPAGHGPRRRQARARGRAGPLRGRRTGRRSPGITRRSSPSRRAWVSSRSGRPRAPISSSTPPARPVHSPRRSPWYDRAAPSSSRPRWRPGMRSTSRRPSCTR